MKKEVRIFVLAAILLLPVCANAITFTSDANIQAGDSWMNVYIHDTPPNRTTITMTGGSVSDHFSLYDASKLNMSSGNVGGLNAYDESTANISGGSVAGLMLYNNATATLSSNGTITNRATMANSSIFSMTGGTINGLGARDTSIINLQGGFITDALGAMSSATINVFGYELAKTSTGGTYGVGQVTGLWQDKAPFTINLSGSDTYSTINLIFIPEPATLLLFGFGALLLRKSRK